MRWPRLSANGVSSCSALTRKAGAGSKGSCSKAGPVPGALAPAALWMAVGFIDSSHLLCHFGPGNSNGTEGPGPLNDLGPQPANFGDHRAKLKSMTDQERMARPLSVVDPEVYEAIQHEVERQHGQLELIASENFTSEAVLEATGSVFTNKYAEGYPGKRYYGGCEFTDIVENLARERAKKLFGAEYANVQPHSGSQANQAAYAAVLQPGDTILGMNLAHGGHLTHGHPLNFSGKTYKVVPYGVRSEDERIDYDELAQAGRRAQAEDDHRGRQRLSAHHRFRALPRRSPIRWARSSWSTWRISPAWWRPALHPNPCEYADIVTSTTHKTLRGPRAGMILAKEKYGAAIDKTVFPGMQGGPLVHVIAAKAVCFLEAMPPEFVAYQKQVVANAQALAREPAGRRASAWSPAAPIRT